MAARLWYRVAIAPAIFHGIMPFGMCFVPAFAGSRHANLPIYCKRLVLLRQAYGKIG